MYIGDEYVSLPLLIALGLMILTVILTQTIGENMGRRMDIPSWKRTLIQLLCLSPMSGTLVLMTIFAVVNYRH